MRLAKAVRIGGKWTLVNPPSDIDKPPINTIVQYESDCHGRYNVYFPGVQWYASISGWVFELYFEDLDDETS